MEFDKYLKTVTNLNKYIAFTWDLQNKRIDLKIPFNISTILSLKNIRSIEIEYFNKCEENGGATKIVEFLLRSPPSKTWGLLGGELINLLQYWLEAIRKHLIIHNISWWTFLKLILKFIKVLSLKDVSLNKILVEVTAECLLDLATHSVPDADQRSEIIQTFNAISAESSRSIRFAYKEKIKEYFTKLSSLLASAGDFPLQHRALESLLRWLLPRHDPAVRRAAAVEWFPEGTYSTRAVDIFLERPWQDFMKDARDFLNAQNKSSDLVTSVICKTLRVGKCICFSDKSDCWLDLNSSTKRLSISLDPRWDALGGSVSHDSVLISDDNTTEVELKQESQEVVITSKVLELSRVYPFSSDVTGDTASCADVLITVSSGSDISRLDRSLRSIFGNKYKVSLDITKFAVCMSPDDKLFNSDVINGTEEDMRFSMPPETSRRIKSGYIVRPRNLVSRNSSTISTTSLAQLHEKLAALPRYTFDKEPVSVCVLPQLSTVSEVTETEENHTPNSSLSTIKYRRYGVTYKRVNKTGSKTTNSTSNNSIDNVSLSPVVKDDENSQSCLLLATIGSTEDSIINETIERLPKNIPCNTDNIINLLAQEALQTNKHNSDTEDSSKTSDVQQVNTVCTNKLSTQVLEDAPLPNIHHIIEELSCDIVENTPLSWVQLKRPDYKSNQNTFIPNTTLIQEPECVEIVHNFETIENFFSQHVTENRNGDIVISPSLARKINETSSECSDDNNQCIIKEDQAHNYIVQDIVMEHCFVTDTDITECVNAMVHKVCEDLNKPVPSTSTELGGERRDERTRPNLRRKIFAQKKSNEDLGSHNFNAKENTKKNKRKASNTLKLNYNKQKAIASKKRSKTPNKTKKDPPFTVMSPIIEMESVVDETVTKTIENINQSPKTTPLLRRKRKLYSPKDDTCHETIEVIELTENDTNTANIVSDICSKTQNPISTCYKELELERKKPIRKRRNLSLKKNQASVSPRTLKMNQIFDSLKDVSDGEPVKLANISQDNKNDAIYNYTSESENESEMKTKSMSMLKDVSNPVGGNVKTSISSISNKQTDKNITPKEVKDKKISKSVKRTNKLLTKKTTQKPRKETASKISKPPKPNLKDEHMRGIAPDVLNTSICIECPKDGEIILPPDKQPDPILIVKPQLECIADENLKSFDLNENNNKPKIRKNLSLKRNKVIPKVNLDLTMADNDGTLSPLPGLLVETALTTHCEINDSVSDNMIQKFKDIYEGKQVIDSEANCTQNLLLDNNESIHCNESNLNVTEKLDRLDKKSNDLYTKKTKKKSNIKKNIKEVGIGRTKAESEKVVAKTRKNQKVDVTQMSAMRDNSERSIATLGSSDSPITAHGDFDENPPNSTLLTERIQPRIVEQEYLNASIKDFFTKLTEQLHESNTSDVMESVQSSSKNYNKIVDSSSIKQDSNNSPVVVVARLSPEYIRSRTSVDSNVVDANISKTIINSDSSTKICRDNKEYEKDESNIGKESDMNTANVKRVVRSTISPIKLCGDFGNKIAKPVSSSSPQSQDNCVKRIKRIFSTKRHAKVQSNSTANESNVPKSSRSTSRKLITSSPISNKNVLGEQQREESPSSRPSASSSKTSKRKCSPILRTLKRSKYDEENNNFGSTITQSEHNSSSVNEWFKRNEPAHTADSINLTLKENLKNVLEKLDTTLMEIHHNTSKRFINMFVDATSQLSDLKDERTRLQRETAADIMSSVVKIVDEKFLQLNERLQSMDDKFMESLKERAHVLIREECKQKKAMVTLLREDVQAVLQHREKTRISQ